MVARPALLAARRHAAGSLHRAVVDHAAPADQRVGAQAAPAEAQPGLRNGVGAAARHLGDAELPVREHQVPGPALRAGVPGEVVDLAVLDLADVEGGVQLVVELAGRAALGGRAVGRAVLYGVVGGHAVAVDQAPVGLQACAVAAGACHQAAAWDDYAPGGGGAPGEGGWADADAAVVVAGGAGEGDDRAGAGGWADGEAGFNGRAVSAAVALVAALGQGEGHAGGSCCAPSVPVGAGAGSAAVVAGRAGGGYGDAGARRGADRESWFSGQTVSAAVVLGAAGVWSESNAFALGGAPSASGCTDAASAAVVARGAVAGDYCAGAGCCADREAGSNGSAVSAVIALGATERQGERNAGSSCRTPRVAAWADTVSTTIIRSRAIGGNGLAGSG